MSAPPATLKQKLLARIARTGPLSVEDYMAAALGDAEHGYYVTRDPLGEAGDFVTAPEVSQMFGEIVGLWAVHMWDAIGRPAPFRFIELGPGRGTLMADMLRAARLVPEFAAAARIDLVETSPVLRARQKETLRDHAAATAWHGAIEDVPEGPSITIANEFFDALPVRQYQYGEDGWRERLIAARDGALYWTLADTPGNLRRGRHIDAVPGDILEISPAREAAAAALAARLATAPGAALVIDYGHAEQATGDTFQAVRGHDYADPLEEPGEADLTAHVAFSSLAETATANGAQAFGPLTQGSFLTGLGIAARAARLQQAAPADAPAIEAGLARLTGPDEMGTVFKVLALTGPGMTPPPPFPPARTAH